MKLFTLIPRLLTPPNCPLMFQDTYTWRVNPADISLPPFVMFLDIPSFLWCFTFLTLSAKPLSVTVLCFLCTMVTIFWRKNHNNEHRRKNHPQNARKLTPATHWKAHTPWSSGVYCRDARSFQHLQINTIYHTLTSQRIKTIWSSQ